jgi:hypothetical protein
MKMRSTTAAVTGPA